MIADQHQVRRKQLTGLRGERLVHAVGEKTYRGDRRHRDHHGTENQSQLARTPFASEQA